MARFSALFLILLLSGCGDALQEFGGPTMGSHYSLKYVQAEGVPPRERLQAEVEGMLAEIDRQMSTWRADSDLSRFNRLPAGACMAMPESVLQLVGFGAQLSAGSEGAFDLTVQPLMDLWGFGAQSRGRRVPAAEEIAVVLPVIGQRHLRIDGGRLCKDAAVRLDLDAIAAGYTVDRIAARLGELGVRNFLLEITGELKAVGRKPDGSPWTVAIEAPRDEGREEQLRLALDGLGVSTSGDYRNYFEVGGQRYSHTFDPRTGRPVSHGLASVSVVAASALRADGLSTTLMVLGPEAGMAYAEREGVAALFIRRDGERFVTRASTAFVRRFGDPQAPGAGM
ncbi:FAD:protein FMN transferase [Pseudomonas sp. F(2018)]|uniref:FAD:protein FMN transferase n=1 Tax=Pseudomonas sp. F(2018) TaxID=2502240 RepID=UPI002114A03D|nr:FAD:protein FMN transferase [Pseudomonas sp. F(2018)]